MPTDRGTPVARAVARPGSALPTLETVAARAGVSRQTVSNALHRPDRLAAATRDKVLEAVRATGYRPSLPARQLATRRAHAVAVRADRPQDGISGMVLDVFFHGLAEAGERSGNRVVLYPEQADEAAELAVVEELIGGGAADAVVLTATNVHDGRPAHLTAAGLTFCAFGRPWGADEPPHDWVDVDGAHGTGLAVAHLLAAGRRRIGFLGWPDDAATGRDRRRGWDEALGAAGVPGPRVEAACENSSATAQACAAALLARDDAAGRPGLRERLAGPRRPPGRDGRRGGPARRRLRRHPGRGRARPGQRGPARQRGRPRLPGAAAAPARRRRPPRPGGAARARPVRARLTPDPPRTHRTTHVHHEGVTPMTSPLTRAARSRRAALPVLTLATLGLVAACGGGSFDEGTEAGGDGGSAAPAEGGGDGLTVLIGSSGDAETEAVTAAVDAWSEESGTEAEVIVATDLTQELTQGFAGGEPPDLFYVDAAAFPDYAVAGNLYPYAEEIEDVDDFIPALRETFTLDGTEYCVPKDFSTLALQINTASWEAAGLTDEDVPTTWEELQTVADTLTTPEQAGLVIGSTPRPGRRVPRAERRLLGRQRRGHRHRDRRGERRGAHLRQGPAGQRLGRAPARRRLRLGRRGVRHRARRDDHRGQLDPGRDDATTTRTSSTPSPSCPRARPARAPCCSRSAGASRRSRPTRRRPSTWCRS